MTRSTITRSNLAERFDPIDLIEMNETAALQERVDRKYLVNSQVLDQLGSWIAPRSRVLEVNGERDAKYRSIYFDTSDLLSFHQAAHGRRRRFKLRTRAYCDSEVAYLEAKIRGTREFTSKARIPHDFAQLDSLTTESREYAGLVLDSVGEAGSRSWDLAPVLETTYQRTTLLVPAPEGEQDPPARITVDTDLSWKLRAAHTTPQADELYGRDLAIIETKSGIRPSSTDRTLWSHGIRPSSFSKYATGLAAMTPSLPANRWARTLNRTF